MLMDDHLEKGPGVPKDSKLNRNQQVPLWHRRLKVSQAALERLVLEGQGSDPCTVLSSGEATTTLLNPALGIPV